MGPSGGTSSFRIRFDQMSKTGGQRTVRAVRPGLHRAERQTETIGDLLLRVAVEVLHPHDLAFALVECVDRGTDLPASATAVRRSAARRRVRGRRPARRRAPSPAGAPRGAGCRSRPGGRWWPATARDRAPPRTNAAFRHACRKVCCVASSACDRSPQHAVGDGEDRARVGPVQLPHGVVVASTERLDRGGIDATVMRRFCRTSVGGGDRPGAVRTQQRGQVARALRCRGSRELVADRRAVVGALDRAEHTERRGRVIVAGEPRQRERQAADRRGARRAPAARPRRRRRPRPAAADRRVPITTPRDPSGPNRIG